MKNKLVFKILITTTLIKSSPSFAEVDLSTGSFIFRDKASPLMNIYNSRSVHQGLLGTGWCTPFEDSVDRSGKTSLRLRDCKLGKILTFHLLPALRSPSSEKSRTSKVYESGPQKIVESENKYILSGEYGVRTFDKSGKLLEIKDERGKLSKLVYDKNGYLKEIVSGNVSGRKDSLKLMVDPRTGRAVEVIDPRGARTRLTFLNGNLISTASPAKTKYFNYDSVTNLIEVIDNKKTTSISYHEDDRVAAVKVGDNCQETYLYTTSTLFNRAEVTTKCRGINNKRLVDFFYSKNSNGEVLLSKVLTTNQQLKDSRLPANQNSEELQ